MESSEICLEIRYPYPELLLNFCFNRFSPKFYPRFFHDFLKDILLDLEVCSGVSHNVLPKGFLALLPVYFLRFSDVPSEICESCSWDVYHISSQDYHRVPSHGVSTGALPGISSRDFLCDFPTVVPGVMARFPQKCFGGDFFPREWVCYGISIIFTSRTNHSFFLDVPVYSRDVSKRSSRRFK